MDKVYIEDKQLSAEYNNDDEVAPENLWYFDEDEQKDCCVITDEEYIYFHHWFVDRKTGEMSLIIIYIPEDDNLNGIATEVEEEELFDYYIVDKNCLPPYENYNDKVKIIEPKKFMKIERESSIMNEMER